MKYIREYLVNMKWNPVLWTFIACHVTIAALVKIFTLHSIPLLVKNNAHNISLYFAKMFL